MIEAQRIYQPSTPVMAPSGAVTGVPASNPVTTRPAISINGVTKRYGDGSNALLALDNLTLQVGEGEFLCMVGASGCGKSTLLKLLVGLYKLDQGTIDVGDHNTALMFQESALFPWLTVEKNIEMAMRFRRAKVPRRQRREKVEELLDLVYLSGFGKKRPHELSGGMRQRVAIARALAQEANILLMDEPFASLDAMTRDVLHDELERIWSQTGMTIMFVTHDVREAVRLGDRVVLLSSRPGRVVAEFPVDIARPRNIESNEVAELSATITAGLRKEVRRHGV